MSFLLNHIRDIYLNRWHQEKKIWSNPHFPLNPWILFSRANATGIILNNQKGYIYIGLATKNNLKSCPIKHLIQPPLSIEPLDTFFSRANATGIILNNQKRYIYIDNQKQSQKLSYNLTLAVNQNWK